jgi:hypothetical protein
MLCLRLDPQVLRLANRYDVRTFRGAKSLRVSPYTTSLGGDPGTLVAMLAVLCVASLLLAAAIAAATCRSSQPARYEALLQELRNAERQDMRADERHRQSIRDVQRPSAEWLGVSKKAPAASASASASASSCVAKKPSISESSSCVSLPIDASNIPDSLRGACLRGACSIGGSSVSCSVGGFSASHSSLAAGPSLRGSTSAPTAGSSKQRSSPSTANPGLRKIEGDAAAAFERHHTREDEILARYAPGARAADGEGDAPPHHGL